MKNICGALLICFVVFNVKGQEPSLPGDFRQHNLTEYNSSFLNPAFALDRNQPSSLALWSRWQWQFFDTDPTSLFMNYTARINEMSAGGIGFFQQNTGIFTNTGATLNYAYDLVFNEKVSLGVGVNLFGYSQKLTDTRFFIPNPLQPEITTDFILQLSPGVNLKIDRFSLGLVSENLFDYNFTTNERNTSPEDRIFMGLASYEFPISILNSDNSSILRPTVYLKSIPGLDTQIGLMGLLSTSKFWAQGGYNSFYGVSFGAGGRFFKRLSLGALVEFGTSTDISGTDPSFELVTAYKLDSPEPTPQEVQEELIVEEIEREEQLKQEMTKVEALAAKKAEKEEKRLQRINEKRAKDSLLRVERENALAQELSKRNLKRQQDSLQRAQQKLANAEAAAILAQRRQDSLSAVSDAREAALAQERERVQDSIEAADLAATALAKEKAEIEQKNKPKEVVKPKAGERYEEVTKEGTLAPGYYLIANVFGTKRYFDAFMADLNKKGLDPKSFYREANKYNYVYLGRFDSIDEARKARDSKLNGRYPEKTWIFRVVGE
jgi:type IX secretion system PorP/SprF family membrane protein